uniref:Integrase catalytic domain-containing protein n=1 Tax=Poecilia latipinna TaxID=48699 RepID=A0A3B3U2M2_9TELE
MRSDIENFCNLCKTCEAFQKAVLWYRAPLQSIQTDRSFQLVCTDITELPVTSLGNRYVLVVQDHFTKYVNACAMSDQKTATVAQLLCEHGVPEELLSEQGQQYESEIIHTICQRLQMTKKRTSPYHPRGNGMVERFNRTLKEQLARLIQDYGGEWDHYLPAVVLSFNSTPHSSTGYSPYFLAHGREPRLPANVHISSPKVSDCPQNYGSELATRMDAAFETVVLHHKEQRQKREPYKVISVDEKGLLYKLVDVKYPQAVTRVIHYDRLKPYRSSTDTLPIDERALGLNSTVLLPAIRRPMVFVRGSTAQ